MKIATYIPTGPQVSREVIAVVIGAIIAYYTVPKITAWIDSKLRN